jgi:hypothetical protein
MLVENPSREAQGSIIYKGMEKKPTNRALEWFRRKAFTTVVISSFKKVKN